MLPVVVSQLFHREGKDLIGVNVLEGWRPIPDPPARQLPPRQRAAGKCNAATNDPRLFRGQLECQGKKDLTAIFDGSKIAASS
jgi:hypothetical protein